MYKLLAKFKETEIGPIPEEWDIFNLKDLIVKANTGLDAIKRAPIVSEDTGIKCLRIQDVSQKKDYKNWGFCNVSDNNYNNFNLKKDDILIARTGETVGVNMFITNDLRAVYNNGLIRLKIDNNKIIPDYLHHYLNSRLFDDFIDSIAFGTSTQPNIQINSLLSFQIILPSKNEQEQIAEILSSLDSKIELNRKINKNLEKLASSLFKQWFVDFEFPTESGKPYKTSGGKIIDSELGKIPDGWSVGFLGDNKLTEFIKPGISKFDSEKIYLPTANVNGSSITDFNYKITYSSRPSRANMQPIPGSIWFAKMKESKKVQLFLDREKWRLDNLILSTGFAGIKPLMGSICYIWTIINSDTFEFKKDTLSMGTTMQGINNDNIRKINYLIPTKNIIDSFEKFALPIYEIISMNNEEIKNISALRDSLLPRLMSGKIRVK
jgi:type I restriction enzyme S subunit